ncbi:hypothetical protein [Algoriphagus aquimarinus]|uniref:hypothetical protein n=1 Tax=Algoriphagus aquimarinus TaxID=237018 RepID=UPI0030D726EF|tara:strand:- start:29952 stop:30635 length:684 start_codon:yes stop_codon:yes gene_type:complete
MLLPRLQVTKNKSIISSEITAFQKAFYDEEMLEEYKENGEEDIYLEMYDHAHAAVINYDFYSKIIGFEHKIIDSYTNRLTEQIKVLLEFSGVTSCYVLSHIKLELCGDKKDDYKPLALAYEKLEKIVGADTYSEAFHVNMEELDDLLEIFFWTVRCDPNNPEYIFFFDEAENLRFNICKYGNIHLTEFNQEKLSDKVLESLGWTVITGPEYDQFTEEGGIEGRRISL